MRIHSDIITRDQIIAAVPSTAYIGKLTEHRSQSRDHSFEVNLGGSGKTGGQWGQLDGKAATWDEWGIFLSALYAIDPDMFTPAYPNGRSEFEWTTVNRFDELDPTEQHTQHRWNFDGYSVTNSYAVHSCKGSKAHKCTATTRRPAFSHTFADVA